MPRNNSVGLSADTEMTLSVIEALKDANVLASLKKALAPSTQEIIEAVTAKVTNHMNQLLKKKDDEIIELKKKVTVLETAVDAQEQYSRKENLRFTCIPEMGDGRPTEDVIVDVINREMTPSPPITVGEIARCHRTGKKSDENKNRAILVRFKTYNSRARVWEKKTALKNASLRMYVSEDLTRSRSTLFYEARLAKREQRIADTWTHDGRILIKDLNGKITLLSDKNQLLTLMLIIVIISILLYITTLDKYTANSAM